MEINVNTSNIEKLIEDAENGEIKAIKCLADLNMKGDKVQQDLDKAIELYESLCLRKDDENFEIGIHTKLGLCYAMSDNLDRAFRNWSIAAEADDAEALHNLGYCYEDGCGVEQDPVKAFEVFKRAADLGFVDSMYEVGYLYKDGIGVEQDFGKSLEYWTLGAERGDYNSMYNIAVLYSGGYGVEENHETAFEWFLKSAKCGYPQAQYILGSCYQDGDGVDCDMALAVKWYRMAAKGGHEGAEQHLEEMYDEGLIVESPEITGDNVEPDTKQNVVEVISSLGKILAVGGTEMSEIRQAEDDLYVQFSEDFIEYTQQFGSISVGDIELCGIVGNSRLSTVKQTKEMRKYFDDFPIDCYVIEIIGIDNAVIVQNSMGNVFMFKPQHELEFAGSSLCDYLLNGDKFRKERRDYWQARLQS